MLGNKLQQMIRAPQAIRATRTYLEEPASESRPSISSSHVIAEEPESDENSFNLGEPQITITRSLRSPSQTSDIEAAIPAPTPAATGHEPSSVASSALAIKRTIISSTRLVNNTGTGRIARRHGSSFSGADFAQITQSPTLGASSIPRSVSPMPIITNAPMTEKPTSMRAGSTDSDDLDFGTFTLPPVVQASKCNWIEILNGCAIVNALLAGVEAELIGNLPTRSQTANTALAVTRYFAYGSIFCNLGGTVAGVLLIDTLSGLELAARDRAMTDKMSLPYRVWTGQIQIPRELLLSVNETSLLLAYGMEPRWHALATFWSYCLPLGVMMTTVHLLVYNWQADTIAVATLLSLTALAMVVGPLVRYTFIA